MPVTIEDAPSGDTGGTTTTTTTGGGGDGNAQQNYLAALKALLQTLGIPLTGNINQLLNQAADKGYSQTTFMYYLRQTAEYAKAFPGIFEADGSLKMSEQQYLAQVRQYEEIAGLYGLKLRPGLIAELFEGDTSPNEYRVRAAAIRQIRDNRVYLEQFNKVLLQKGIIDHRLTPRELQAFVLGEADPEWYKVWRETQARSAAVMAGLNFAKPGARPKNADLRLPANALKTLMAAGLTGNALTQAVESIAENFLKTLPLSQVYSEGLSKKDIVTAIVGGKHSAAIQARIERLLVTHQAFEEEERANPQLYATQPGTTAVLGASGKKPLYE